MIYHVPSIFFLAESGLSLLKKPSAAMIKMIANCEKLTTPTGTLINSCEVDSSHSCHITVIRMGYRLLFSRCVGDQ